MFHLDHRPDAIGGHGLDRVLVGEEIGALDGIKSVLLGRIVGAVGMIAKGRVEARARRAIRRGRRRRL
jgi:hypothetical protein